MSIPTFVKPPSTYGWHSHDTRSVKTSSWRAPSGGHWQILLNRGPLAHNARRLILPQPATIVYTYTLYLFLPSPFPPAYWQIEVKVEIPGYPGGGYWVSDRWDNVQGEEHELRIHFQEDNVKSLYHQESLKNNTREMEGDITLTGEPT